MLLLVGAALRIAPLTDNRFHQDEALYATLAKLVVSGKDPFLVQTPLLVDKPPLFYYVLSLSMAVTGWTEISARLPGVYSSLLSLALVTRLSWIWWRSRQGAMLTLLFCCLSPIDIAFAPTAFTDPQLVMWLLAATTAIVSGRWGWAGALLGFALATKQAALYFVPFVVLMGILQNVKSGSSLTSTGRAVLRCAAALALIIALVAVWDVMLRQGVTSFWTAGSEANNPGRLARTNEIIPNALRWLGWMQYITGSALLTVICSYAAIILCASELWLTRRHWHKDGALIPIGMLILYCCLIWLIAFPLLDRYILSMAPFAALLFGRSTQRVAQMAFRGNRSGQRAVYGFAATFVAILASMPALSAARSELPVGEDHGANDGIVEVVSFLARQPAGTVVYSRAEDWLLHYYLFDLAVYPAYIENPEHLQAELAAFRYSSNMRFLLLSNSESSAELLAGISIANFCADVRVIALDRSGQVSMTLYQLYPIR